MCFPALPLLDLLLATSWQHLLRGDRVWGTWTWPCRRLCWALGSASQGTEPIGLKPGSGASGKVIKVGLSFPGVSPGPGSVPRGHLLTGIPWQRPHGMGACLLPWEGNPRCEPPREPSCPSEQGHVNMGFWVVCEARGGSSLIETGSRSDPTVLQGLRRRERRACACACAWGGLFHGRVWLFLGEQWPPFPTDSAEVPCASSRCSSGRLPGGGSRGGPREQGSPPSSQAGAPGTRWVLAWGRAQHVVGVGIP